MKKREIVLEYQNTIPEPPLNTAQLHAQACSNDGATVSAWKDQWIAQIRGNAAKYKFSDQGIGSLHGKDALKPVIIAGSGPSLKFNADKLKNRHGITLISCLHNFHFMEDQGIAPEYYVTLDAGEVTIGEVSEGGSKSADEYWAMTEKRTLLAFIGTHPELLAKWRGKILFYNVAIPGDVEDGIKDLPKFKTYISTGGNVLGSSLYIAKAILGGNPIAFVGADFSFGYDKRFHPWESKYDKDLGNVVYMTDVYGNRVASWQSYANFKAWFDWVACRIPGMYVNCTEGGTFGAYPMGNIAQVQQMDLDRFLEQYAIHQHTREVCERPADASQVTIVF